MSVTPDISRWSPPQEIKVGNHSYTSQKCFLNFISITFVAAHVFQNFVFRQFFSDFGPKNFGIWTVVLSECSFRAPKDPHNVEDEPIGYLKWLSKHFPTLSL